MALERNSVNIEIEKNFKEIINQRISEIKDQANEYNANRIQEHIDFIKDYSEKNGLPPYENKIYDFPVKTKQEVVFRLRKLEEIKFYDDSFYEVSYEN
jgi:hypothetical protein